LNPGDGFIYLGTAPGFGLCVDRKITDDIIFELGLACPPFYGMSERWLLEGVLSVSGASLTWYIEQFYASPEEVVEDRTLFDRLESEAGQITPGSEGLFFMPHLMGERCPENPEARAVLYGLSLGHTRAHIARSMYEGIGFALRRAIELVEEKVGLQFKTFTVFGGGTNSRLLLQILANVLGQPMLLPKEEEIGALGLARVASTLVRRSHLERVSHRRSDTAIRVKPQSGLVKSYDEFYRQYKKIDEVMVPRYEDSTTTS
jgi:xylulokinase